MAEFLLEAYVSRTDPAGAERRAVDADLAAEHLRRDGVAIRYMRSIFVPEDETCFFLFEADDRDDVLEAARRARLPLDRLVMVITQPEPAEAPPIEA